MKKIRDTVGWADAELPWRRAGEWTAVKAVLHVWFVGRLGAVAGTNAYKAEMLAVMTAALERGSTDSSLEGEVLLHMAAKVARRAAKLRARLDAPSGSGGDGDGGAGLADGSGKIVSAPTTAHYEAVLQRASAAVVAARAVLDGRWTTAVADHAADAAVVLCADELQFLEDTRLSLKTAAPHLSVALAPSRSLAFPTVATPVSTRRVQGTPQAPFFPGFSGLAEDDQAQALWDFETWVTHVCLDLVLVTDATVPEMCAMLVYYLQVATPFYAADPVGHSAFVLTAYTLAATVDAAVCTAYPLLKEHAPGVDLLFLTQLLLPHAEQLRQLAAVEAYFLGRADGASKPALLATAKPTADSFAVRFARQNAGMRAVHGQILVQIEANLAAKEAEVLRARRMHEHLLEQATTLSCTFITGKNGRSRHSYSCTKCSLTQRASRMQVTLYEKLLPDDTVQQLAVVYDLCVPRELSHLADALYVLRRDVCGSKPTDFSAQSTWSDHGELSRWVKEKAALVKLGSATKPFGRSHYNSGLHPSSPLSDFVVPNGCDAVWWSPASNSYATLDKHDGRSVEIGLKVPDGPYHALQWTVSGTTHNANEVLCRQSSCPPELGLSEFVTFGSLRAGGHLQLRNILHAISALSLSFDTPAVGVLLFQALWEAGPPMGSHDESCAMWRREAHADGGLGPFARELVATVSGWLSTVVDNWEHHRVLLVIVTILGRVLALAGRQSWSADAADALRTCRQVAHDWAGRVEDAITALPADAPMSKSARLRERLVDVAATGALTFDVDPEHLSLVLSTQEDVVQWLRAVARIHDNTLLTSGQTDSSHSAESMRRRVLLRRVYRAGLRLYPVLRRVLSGSALTTFVESHWADGSRGSPGEWTPYTAPSERWYHTMFVMGAAGAQHTVLQLDVLRGAFLVNGAPVGRLPSNISGHCDFTRVFGRTILEVQPAAGRPGAYVTAKPRGGSFFSFGLEADGRLIVVERRPDGRELALFPARFLSGDLPRAMVDRHSHWLSDGVMLFRPISATRSDFAPSGLAAACPYLLNLRTRGLTQAPGGSVLVDVRGSSFKHLYDAALCRLADRRDVHVWRAPVSGSVTVALPLLRLHLEVEVKCSGAVLLASRELPGYCVAASQGIGTLTGLAHGLVLVDGAPGVHEVPHRRLLIPHGPLLHSTVRSSSRVAVDVNALCEPPFFVYDVADRLQRLWPTAPSRTALLYLVLLHVWTSGTLPDPFTGMAGAEAGLRLLQGGSCWSNSPASPRDVELLAAIKTVAPRRSFYPTHIRSMECTAFPSDFVTGLVGEALWFAVLALELDGAGLAFLFPGSAGPPQVKDAQLWLSTKAYWRGRDAVGPEQRLTAATEKRLTLTAPAISEGRLWQPFRPSNSVTFLAVRTLARIVEADPEDVKPVAELLSSVEHLDGARLALGRVRDHGNIVTSWRDVKGERHWLGIYEYCRQAGSPVQVRYFLSLLVWRGQLTQADAGTLQLISQRRGEFFPPPVDEGFFETADRVYKSSTVTSLISACGVACDLQGVEEEDEPSVLARHRHRREAAVEELEAVVCAAWPVGAIDLGEHSSCHSYVQLDAASSAVSKQLDQWFRNRRLYLWLRGVDLRVSGIVRRRPPPLRPFSSSCGSTLAPPSAVRFAIPSAAWRVGANPVSPRLLSIARAVFSTGQFEDGDENEVDGGALPPPPAPPPVPAFPALLEPASADSDAIVRHSRAVLRSSWSSWQRLQSQRSSACDTAEPSRRGNWQRDIDRALSARRSNCSAQAQDLWAAVQEGLSPQSREEYALFAAGLWSRLAPSLLLPRLLDSDAGEADLAALLGAAAVCWTLAARAERCLALLGQGPEEEFALRRELQNKGRRGWSPVDRPEWLLLELEQGWLVRDVQAQVANRMITPKGAADADVSGGEDGAAAFAPGDSLVLQLNMGEGKTACIVPLLAATLANGQQLFRCTVLRALLPSNANSLTAVLGGLLGRRVWAFPCRRDLHLGEHEALQLLLAYQRCAAERGIVVTLPEHRLSFQLMGLERCFAGCTEDAVALRSVLEWLSGNVRDCIDESDSILDVRYQLVYAIGDLLSPGGGPLRWRVQQGVLRLVRRHAETLLAEYGQDAVELDWKVEGGGAAFPHLRILDAAVYPRLCQLVVDDVLAGRGLDKQLQLPLLRSGEKDLIRRLLLEPRVAQADVNAALRAVSPGSSRDTLLSLRGLLSFGVLLMALQKRHRVNYGVRPSAIEAVARGVSKRGPEYRLMAVPFRAKDVPAERAEFAHSCLALILTHLSYYSSGLTDAQLDDCFSRLLRLDSRAAEAEYLLWIQALDGDPLAPSTANVAVPASVRSLGGVNLSDYSQRLVLFPLLRRNMATIDFFLNKAVFPVEAKVFPGRLSASAWDLCRPVGSPVVGFSGTNETALLLPPSIAQRDLPDLQHTSGMVVAALLMPENQRYTAMPPCASGRDILQRICEESRPTRVLRVLLDVGALMKGLDNAGVAAAWLELTSPDDIDAAIYFDTSNLCVAVDRSGLVTALAVSPFCHRMGRCVTYLDESHTRGTDLRFPAGTHAVLTLGRGITKDRLVQGAMRMRRLGQFAGGHTVSFVASAEVHATITADDQQEGRTLGSADVVLWALRNSEAFLRDGFHHWATRGLDRARAIAAERVGAAAKAAPTLRVVGALHVQRDPVELVALYGWERRDVSAATSVRLRSAALVAEMGKRLPCQQRQSVRSSIAALASVVTSRCDAYVGSATRLEMVQDEEQERELEQELEEEREGERPGLAEPRLPVVHPDVQRMAAVGGPVSTSSRAFVPLATAFLGTTFEDLVEDAAWTGPLWCTAEFTRVLAAPDGRKLDGYLRPPTWLLATAHAVVLLHPHEANAIVPTLRRGNGVARLHLFAPRRRPSQRCLALTPGAVLPPPSSPGGVSPLLGGCGAAALVRAALLGGALYYCCPTEAAVTAATIGVAARPHSAAVAAAFASPAGPVGRDGFVDAGPDRARLLPAAAMAAAATGDGGVFTRSPLVLLRKLIDVRHAEGGGVSHSHAAGVYDRCAAPVVYAAQPPESDASTHAGGSA